MILQRPSIQSTRSPCPCLKGKSMIITLVSKSNYVLANFSTFTHFFLCYSDFDIFCNIFIFSKYERINYSTNITQRNSIRRLFSMFYSILLLISTIFGQRQIVSYIDQAKYFGPTKPLKSRSVIATKKSCHEAKNLADVRSDAPLDD